MPNIYMLFTLNMDLFLAGKITRRQRSLFGKIIARVDCKCGRLAHDLLPKVADYLLALASN